MYHCLKIFALLMIHVHTGINLDACWIPSSSDSVHVQNSPQPLHVISLNTLHNRNDRSVRKIVAWAWAHVSSLKMCSCLWKNGIKCINRTLQCLGFCTED